MSGPRGIYARWGKRVFDLALGVPALVVALPIFAVLAAVVALRLGRPVFFRQSRPGKNEIPFTILKFRTMRDARGREDDDAARLTPFGRFLRSTSLDEIPGILNVIAGEMSLVGPRPLLMQYLPRYTAAQRRRHDVRPGVTGWAQVNGRNAISWETKFEHDLWYVEHLSFGLDLKILLLTLRKVLSREGIQQPGRATMEEFLGSDDAP